MSETVTAVVNTESIMLLAPIQEYDAPDYRGRQAEHTSDK